ncbi:MAG: hypothetical protein ABSG88_12755 [Bradyrhizobium sp.]
MAAIDALRFRSSLRVVSEENSVTGTATAPATTTAMRSRDEIEAVRFRRKGVT